MAISYQPNRKKRVSMVYNGATKVGFIEQGNNGWIYKPKGGRSHGPFESEAATKCHIESLKDFGTAAEREVKPNNKFLTLK